MLNKYISRWSRLNLEILCADKIQRFEAYIPGYCPNSGKTNGRITCILAIFYIVLMFLVATNLMPVQQLMLYSSINFSIVKEPRRLTSSTFELTGRYFRGELHHFGLMDWQKISLGPLRAQKCLISVCSFNSIL